MASLERRMPFQSHEEEEWRGGERKEPRRRYLPESCDTQMKSDLE
jgi:hypothetical protein